MENLRKNFLLGINKEENKIYFGEIAITTRNGYKEFTASFDVGEAFDIDEIDETYKQNYYEDLWSCFDSEQKLNYLNDGEKTKQEVFDDWDYDDDYRQIKDCSCTDYETELNNGQIINFESTCGGQHDIRKNIEEYKNIIFTDKKAVDFILELWDKYHLKDITENHQEVETKIKYILEKLDKYNSREYKNIENFIKENIKEI